MVPPSTSLLYVGRDASRSKRLNPQQHWLKSQDSTSLNPLIAELNPVRHLLALLGAHYILHFSRVRINLLATDFFFKF